MIPAVSSLVFFARQSHIFLLRELIPRTYAVSVRIDVISCQKRVPGLEQNKLVDVKLSYSKGLDRYYGLVELAEKHGIFKKVSTRYELPDGRKVFGKSINENPTEYYTKEILDLIDAAAKKEFLYGSEDEDLEVVNVD